MSPHPAFAALLFVAACGSNVDVRDPASSGGTTSGSGGGEQAGGGGSSSSSTSFTTSSSSSSSSSSGFGGECDTAFFTIVTPDAETELLSVCGWGAQQTTRPVAYYFSGGAAFGTLVMEACATEGGTPEVRLDVLGAEAEAPGTYDILETTYAPDASTTWTGAQPSSVTIVAFGPKPGTVVEGKYEATLEQAGTTMAVAGTFRACRVDDEILP